LTQLTLFDKHIPTEPMPVDVIHDPRVRIRSGLITDAEVIEELVEESELAVIHLASMVSGDSETSPFKAWEVNVDAQRVLLDTLHRVSPRARFVFTSSTATFGPVAPRAPPPGDFTKQQPRNTYGFHKVVCEMMLNDYSRQGLIDGRGLRLPVVVVRPGAPNKALTTCWSSVVRDPLSNKDVSIPVPADSRMPVASYQIVVRALEQMMNTVSSEELGFDKMLTLPAVSASPRELYDAAARLAAERDLPIGKLHEELDPVATRVVQGMGSQVDGDRALGLGILQDESVDSIVRSYADDFVFGGVELEDIEVI